MTESYELQSTDDDCEDLMQLIDLASICWNGMSVFYEFDKTTV